MTHPYPPGPKGNWLTGSLRDFNRDPLTFLADLSRDYDDLCAFRLGPYRTWLVSSPDLIEQVLLTDNKRYIKDWGSRVYSPLLGNGLLLSEGGFWLRQRRLAQPAFLKHRIAGYVPIMLDLTEEMLASWSDGMTIDVPTEMGRLTANIAARTFFGAGNLADQAEFSKAAISAIEVLNGRIKRFIPWPNWLPLPSNLRLKRALRLLDSIVAGFIAQGRARTEPSDDLLSMLLHAQDEDGGRMTDQQLRDEAMTLFLAGHETTALALSWTWLLIAQHPEVEANLLAEWNGVLGDRPAAADDLPRLRYTEWVIQESMRLYPPAYLIGREPIEDGELGGYHLPKGTTIFLSQWATHRNPRYWDEPDRFRPERWGEERVRQMPKFAYFPFGGGPRICIGNHFAMLELALVLATIGRRYRFTVVPNAVVDTQPMITLRPVPGIPAMVRRRDGR